MKGLYLLLFFFPLLVFGQSKKQKKLIAAQQKENLQVINNIKGHIETMQSYQNIPLITNDSVINYLENQFKEAGILPVDSNGFIQTISIDEGKEIDSSTFLRINGKELLLDEDYFPFAFSPNRTVNGMPAIALREKNQPWFVELNSISNTQKTSENNLWNIIRREAIRAAGKGATVLIIYNANAETALHFNANDTSQIAPIPVVYISFQALKKYIPDQADFVEIELNVLLKPKKYEAKNIIGLIDNGASNSILIKAYLPNNFEKKNNDTKSYTFCESALLIELAKMLKGPKYKYNNFLFSINGINDNYALPINRTINYSVILSNIQFSPNATALYLYGFETTPAWKQLLPTIDHGMLQVNFDSNGSKPQFITPNFAEPNPYLLFTTNDPSLSNQNFELHLDVIKYILKIIEKTNGAGQLVYNRKLPEESNDKRDAATTTNPDTSTLKKPVIPNKQTVSFGIIIDRIYTGNGLKIKGLIPKKLGLKIGLREGDILTSLGTYSILNYKSYFDVLSKFHPGDNTTLKIKRNDEVNEIQVTF